jgi:biopolymer transport protein ExbB
MLEMIQAGGIIMYLIILGSIVALGFIIERFVVYNRSQLDMENFFAPLEEMIRLGKIEEAAQYCQQQRKLLPRLFLLALVHFNENIDEIRKILVDEIQIHTIPSLQKNLSILSTIAKGAPMLGLLGTVGGMINTFEVIAIYGLGDPQKMADGIRFALVTTAGGLIVAIPILFVHTYFRSRIKHIELEIRHYTTKFLRLVQARKEVA